tara:strand:- start:14503 stop:14718 length:216 start_codon:yes stop_codon:yes gene_type:complete
MIHKRCKTISKILKFGPRFKSLCTPVSSEWVVEDVKSSKLGYLYWIPSAGNRSCVEKRLITLIFMFSNSFA